MYGKRKYLKKNKTIVKKVYNKISRPLAIATHNFKRHYATVILRPDPVNPGSWLSGFGSNAWLSAQPRTPSSGAGGVYDVAIGAFFRLRDQIDYTDLTALYDKYKFDKVLVTVATNSDSASMNSSAMMPTLYTAYDCDDANPPASLADIQRLDRVSKKVFTSSKLSATKAITPYQIVGVYDANVAALAPAGVRKAQYTNCAYQDIEHVGFKAVLADFVWPTSPTYNQEIRIDVVAYMSMKNPQ